MRRLRGAGESGGAEATPHSARGAGTRAHLSVSTLHQPRDEHVLQNSFTYCNEILYKKHSFLFLINVWNENNNIEIVYTYSLYNPCCINRGGKIRYVLYLPSSYYGSRWNDVVSTRFLLYALSSQIHIIE